MPQYLIRAWEAETEDEDDTEIDGFAEGDDLADALRKVAAELDGSGAPVLS